MDININIIVSQEILYFKLQSLKNRKSDESRKSGISASKTCMGTL